MTLPLLSEVLDAAPDGMGIVSADGRVVQANKALVALIGGPLPGRTLLELTRNPELEALAKRACNGETGQMELQLAVPRRTLMVHGSPLPNKHALCVVRDVTEAKRMERARRDFVANASHELRTPVTAIAGAAETLLVGALNEPESAKVFAEMIARHAERLAHLTQELLDLSRIESGEWEFKVERISILPAVQTVFDLVRPRAEQRRMTLISECPEASVLADRRALEQMLVNLVDNAIKYTPAGGSITVRAEPCDGQTILSVIDTGPGIERHHLNRLFERFYRVDPGRSREAGGTGLGLAIVKHLAQAQHGEVGVDTGPEGSRFWIRLPA